MNDLIELLPDNIANQIAAGEVIQRPASAVKELMENAIDAGASQVKLIVQDAGKSLVQVIDNGRGMSVTDARMAFERHATSKIRNIEDLFRIHTMGFRGEALASIAAVAQVELKTKRPADENGTFIEIENSVVRKQEPVAFPNGTSIAMKNLFFNVPARRNFLKSNAAELRHIVDEFIRVALSFPDIRFILISHGQEVFHLEKGTLKQRIVQILGVHYTSKLVTVQENTDYLNVVGFVGKPDVAKRTRGDQYFFVNNRFIRSAYLNHAVMTAFQQMIPGDSFPLYVLFIEIDPSRVDINVHPTKQEIKFEDEKIVYAFVQAAVKHALAQFSITPSLDFDLDPAIQQLDAINKPVSPQASQDIESSSLFKTFTRKNQAHFIEPVSNSELAHWRTIDKENRMASADGSDASLAGAGIRADDFPGSPVSKSTGILPDDFSGLPVSRGAGNQSDYFPDGSPVSRGTGNQSEYFPDGSPISRGAGNQSDYFPGGLPVSKAGLTAAAAPNTGQERIFNQGESSSSFQSLYARFTGEPLFRDQELKLTQLQNTYIICETSGGFLLIHQQAAHERVLYEKFMLALNGKPLATQPGLFPVTLTLSTPDAFIMQELLPGLQSLGYAIEPFGKDSFIIQGVPAGHAEGNEKKVIENLLEHCKHSGSEKIDSLQEKMIRSLAWQQATKAGAVLSEPEMRSLVESLFRCMQPNTSPNGKPVFVEFKKDYLEKVFGRLTPKA
jgi:DNA mismatch repair protein MutL